MRITITCLLIVLRVSGLYSQTLLADYDFTGAAGTDNSGNGNTGTVFGSSTMANTLIIGYNTSDYFSIPPAVLNNKLAFSISFSINFTGLNVVGNFPTNHIISGDAAFATTTFGFSYQKSLDMWRFALNGLLYDFPDSSILLGQWYCVTLTRDNTGAINLYINGVQHAYTFYDTTLTDISSLLIGQETDCFAGCFAADQCAYAMIDNVRIYSGVITAGIINANCICNPPPAPLNATSPGAGSICEGRNAVLSATGTGTLNWYAGPGTTAVLSSGASFTTPVLSAGTYSYYVAAVTCSAGARTLVTVTVAPSPVVSAGSATICQGAAYAIVPSGTYAYSITGNSFTVSPAVTTVYTVTGLSAMACVGTISLAVVVNMCTGISALPANQENKIQVAPNPFTSELTLIASSGCGYEILNGLGQVLASGVLQAGSNRLNFLHLPVGLYFLKAGTAGAQAMTRIIKTE